MTRCVPSALAGRPKRFKVGQQLASTQASNPSPLFVPRQVHSVSQTPRANGCLAERLRLAGPAQYVLTQCLLRLPRGQYGRSPHCGIRLLGPGFLNPPSQHLAHAATAHAAATLTYTGGDEGDRRRSRSYQFFPKARAPTASVLVTSRRKQWQL